MIMLEAVINWIAGVDNVADVRTQAKQTPTRRLKNEAELREHVIVSTNEKGQYIVYTHDFVRHTLPTEAEKRASLIYRRKNDAIAAGRHLIRKLHSTQPHPALVF